MTMWRRPIHILATLPTHTQKTEMVATAHMKTSGAFVTAKCHIQVVESHICCQACLFASICWKKEEDRRRLPCPSDNADAGSNPSSEDPCHSS